MRALCFGLMLLTAGLVRAAGEPAAFLHEGKLSTTRLIDVSRLTGMPGKADVAPDGLWFAFLVTPTVAANGKFTLKETRDVRVAGKSYRELTQGLLNRAFEPRTEINDTARFLARHPRLRLAETPRQSLVLTVALPGARLTAGDEVDIVLRIGFGKETEEIVFRSKVPPIARPR